MLGKVLQSLSITYEEAEDGLQAIEKVQLSLRPEQKDVPNARRFDLILCDNIMPNMCGPAAVRSIRTMGYTGPIFGVTGTLGQDFNICAHAIRVQELGCLVFFFHLLCCSHLPLLYLTSVPHFRLHPLLLRHSVSTSFLPYPCRCCSHPALSDFVETYLSAVHSQCNR